MLRYFQTRILLRIDSVAASVSGATSLLAGRWMAEWTGLPRGLFPVLGGISLLYSLYSGSLAARVLAPQTLLRLLVVANAAYAVACCALMAVFWNRVGGLGSAYLALEAGFVAGLAAIEWRVFAQDARAARRMG